MFDQNLPWICPAHEDGHRGGNHEVDVEELCVPQVCVVGVKDHHTVEFEHLVNMIFSQLSFILYFRVYHSLSP